MGDRKVFEDIKAANERIAELEAQLVAAEGVHEELAILHLQLVKRDRERELAQRELAESEGRFRALFENKHAIMLIIDPDTGLIEDANPAATVFYGYTMKKLKSMSIMQINTLPPKKISKKMGQVKKGESNHFEFQHRLANGDIRDVEVFSGPVKIHGKQLLFSIIHDITAKKQAEEQLNIYKLLITSTPDMISLVDRDYVYRLVNDAYVTNFGKSREEIVGTPVPDLLGEEYFETTSKPNLEKAFEGTIHNVDTTLDIPNRGLFHLSATYHPVKTDDGHIEYVAIIARDVTQVRQNQQALKEYSDRLDLATDAGLIGIWELDVATRTVIWDKMMMHLYRVRSDQFGGVYEDWRKHVHPDDLFEAEQEIRNAIDNKARISNEFRIIWPNGEIRYIKSDGVVQTNEDGVVIRMTGVNQDITERRKLEEKLRRLATTDSLTGANNRRQFMTRGLEEVARSNRYQTPTTMLTLDIDLFKRINDTYGHPAGDEVLKSLVTICRATLRTSDIFARMGGEEFSALLPETDIEEGIQAAQRLRKAVEVSRVIVDDDVIKYTISIGVSQLQEGDKSLNDLMQRADRALYIAKDAGRNRVETA